MAVGGPKSRKLVELQDMHILPSPQNKFGFSQKRIIFTSVPCSFCGAFSLLSSKIIAEEISKQTNQFLEFCSPYFGSLFLFFFLDCLGKLLTCLLSCRVAGGCTGAFKKLSQVCHGT